jgi:AraC-like DNA-binding protein
MGSDLFTILATIVLFQFVLLSFFLFTIKKGKRLSNLLLGSFLLLLAINITDGLLTYYRFYRQYPSLALIEDSFILLYGPLILFYSRSIIYKNYKLTAKTLFHGIPFFVLFVLSVVGYHVQPSAQQLIIQSAIIEHRLPVGLYLMIVAVHMHILIYLFLAWREVTIYRTKIKEILSSTYHINLDWLSFMIYSLAFLLLLSLVNGVIPLTSFKGYFDAGLVIVFVFLFFFVNAIVIKGLKHPEIFSGIEVPEAIQKYRGSTLTAEERDAIQANLTHLMISEKIFLNPEITLEDLSQKLSVSSRKLSQFLNEICRQNYFDFINSYRIEEAKRLIVESKDPKTTVLEIMYQAGFNSKSSFNTLFKKKTGLTPSEYKKRVTV